MKIGNLVKFVGDANFYKGRIGVVTKLYNAWNVTDPPKSALVYFPGAEGQGRDVSPRRNVGDHPMALKELEIVA